MFSKNSKITVRETVAPLPHDTGSDIVGHALHSLLFLIFSLYLLLLRHIFLTLVVIFNIQSADIKKYWIPQQFT